MNNVFEKLFPEEEIQVGDIVSIEPCSEHVTLAHTGLKNECNNVIGVCTKIENNSVYVASTGIVDVNVEGIICIGDKLTTCEKLGKARAIKYNQDETQFGIRNIGKVIGLYRTYDKAKVLLDVE